jgi:hypothetical protein
MEHAEERSMQTSLEHVALVRVGHLERATARRRTDAGGGLERVLHAC